MKKYYIAVLVALGVVCGTGCKKNSDAGFNPEDRTTVNLSEQEKNERLQSLKTSYGLNIDSLISGHNVKMSVLPPSSSELTDAQAEAMAVRMLQMLSQNGIGGLNTSPGFALTATITPNSKRVTETAPQKYMVNYDVNYSVINTASGDVYSTVVQKIQGVGNSFEQAINNAINEVTPNAESSRMLADASRKIIQWYNNNLPTLRKQISAAEAEGNYALALALIQAVPQEATEAFAYAESRRAGVENEFLQQISQNELTALKQAVAESNNEPSAEVYAHYGLISPNSKSYSEAQSVLKKYEQDVETKRAQDSAKRQANLEAERQQMMELARMEDSRIKAKYQAQASEQAIRLYLSQNSSGGGFWRNIGARIIGAIDGTNWQYRVKDKPYTDD